MYNVAARGGVTQSVSLLNTNKKDYLSLSSNDSCILSNMFDSHGQNYNK